MQQNKSLRRSSSDHSVDAARSLMRSGARRWQISIDIISGAHAQQQTSRTPLLLSIGGTDRQSDGPVHIRSVAKLSTFRRHLFLSAFAV